MNPHPECGPCLLKWLYERASDSADSRQRFTILKRVMQVLGEHFDPSANLGTVCNHALQSVDEFLAGSAARYDSLKRKSNEEAKRLMKEADGFIQGGSTPGERFVRGCGIASAGNVAPIGAPSGPFEFTRVEEIVRGKAPLPAPSGNVFDAAAKAGRVLYVADNAGEIGFDSLLIKLLRGSGAKVTLFVKEEPFFDDATPEDVHYFGLEKIADSVVAVKGIFVPQEAKPDLAHAFDESDLVISKGTGNFEALKGYPGRKPILFLLKAKCRPVSEHTGIRGGEFFVGLDG